MGLPKLIHIHGSLICISVLAEPSFPIMSATAIAYVDCGNFDNLIDTTLNNFIFDGVYIV